VAAAAGPPITSIARLGPDTRPFLQECVVRVSCLSYRPVVHTHGEINKWRPITHSITASGCVTKFPSMAAMAPGAMSNWDARTIRIITRGPKYLGWTPNNAALAGRYMPYTDSDPEPGVGVYGQGFRDRGIAWSNTVNGNSASISATT
jgi:hypothetical protein